MRATTVAFALAAALLPAAASGAPLPSDDPALDRRCSVQAFDRPLKSVLAELSRATGARLVMAPDYEDRWAAVRVRERPLREVMRSLAALYMDEWAVQKGPPRVYVLRCSTDRLRLQARLMEAWKETLKSELIRSIRDTAQNGPEPWMLDGMETEEERAMFTEDMKGRARVLGNLPEGWLDAILDGRSIIVHAADARGAFGDALFDFGTKTAFAGFGPEAARPAARSWFEFESEQYNLRGQSLICPTFTVGSTGEGATLSRYNIVVNPDRFPAALAEKLRDLLPKPELTDAERRARLEALATQPPESQAPAASANLLKRGEQVRRLAEWLNLDVVADCYLRIPEPPAPLQGLKPAAAAEAVAKELGCDWTVRGPFLSLRHRTWWVEDRADPPASRTEAWTQTQQARGFLNLDDMAELGRLNGWQLGNLRLVVPGAGIAERPFFRFWATLDATQRRQLQSKAGLPAGRIPARARALLLTGWGESYQKRDPMYAAGLEVGQLYVQDETGERPIVRLVIEFPKDAHGHVLSRGFREGYELPNVRKPPAGAPARPSAPAAGGQ